MPRFVILEHDHPELHWDLMLEMDGILKTWRLPAPPPDRPASALAIGDHRLAYLEYEGPVSGARGHVKRWDRGTYDVLEATGEMWAIRVQGEHWRAGVRLRRRHGQEWSVEMVGE